MNTEHNNTPDILINNEVDTKTADLANFTVNGYLRPFLDEIENPFITPQTANQLKIIIPRLIVDVISAAQNLPEEDQNLIIGGSSMEVFSGLISAEYYWATKKHFIDSFHQTGDDTQSADKVTDKSLKTLAHGDADLDIYVKNDQVLTGVFDNYQKNYPEAVVQTTESGARQFKIKLTNSNISLTVYEGPMGDSDSRKRLYFRLRDDLADQPLFHIDMTPQSTEPITQANDRRKRVGSVHDLCQGKIDTETGELSINLNDMPKPDEQSYIRLKEKSISAIPEIVMREVRKKMSHYVFKKDASERFTIEHIFPLIHPNETFFLREITSDSKYEIDKAIDEQSEHKKAILYRELFLMAQIDPYLTTLFLQDTGFDAIFFSRHLTRKEGLGILTSPWLRTNDEDASSDDSLENVRKSREKYLEMSPDNQSHNGFVRFVSAIGQVLGPYPLDFKRHFSDGLNIINQTTPLPEIKPQIDKPENEQQFKMYEAIVAWGSLTERALHNILRKNNPDHDQPSTNIDTNINVDVDINKIEPETKDDIFNSFEYNFFKLKSSGLIEVAKRTITINGIERQVDLYYPTYETSDIVSLLPLVTDKNQEQYSPTTQEYWQAVSEYFTETPEDITSEVLLSIWKHLVLEDVLTIEGLLAINESDLKVMNLALADVISLKPTYRQLEAFRSFLIARQNFATQSWLDPLLKNV